METSKPNDPLHDTAKQNAPAKPAASPTPGKDEERRQVNPGEGKQPGPHVAHPQTGIVGSEGPDAAADPARTRR